MRTVHETEALRPSDPVPKSMQPLMKPGTRLKLVIKQQHEYTDGSSLSPGHSRDQTNEFMSSTSSEHDHTTNYSSEAILTSSEIALDPRELWRLLRRQVHWAEEESDSLQRECEMIEAIRKKEWAEKEILLEQVMKNETDWHERRQLVLATLPSAAELKAQVLSQMEAATAESQETVEAPKEDQQEAAAVLASLAQA